MLKTFLRFGIRGAILLGATSFLMILLYAFSLALTPAQQLTTSAEFHIPDSFAWSNFLRPFQETDFGYYLRNSLIVGMSVTLLNIFTCTLAGYGFAKHRFVGRDAMFLIVLATLMIPVEIIYVPLFKMIHDIGWVDSFAALIVPAGTSAFGIFLMRQAAGGIPEEILEAARIDGAGELKILVMVVAPLLSGSMAVLAIFVFITNWDSHLWPLLVSNSKEVMTLPVGLANIQAGAIGNANLPMIVAAAIIAVLPTLLLFLTLQRRFVEGIAASAGLK